VLNSQTGEPIKNALVTLVQLPAPLQDASPLSSTAPRAPINRPLPTSKTALTGLGGEFLFSGLAEGQYRLSSEKPQFVSAEESPPGRPRVPGLIQLKSSISDVRLKLAPLGVIEGQILDQYGEPVRGVNVVAISVKIEDGFRTTHSDRSVVTDDQGKYRLWNLSPGKYFIKAAGRSGGTYNYVGNDAVLTDTWEGFLPVYAGGARELEAATPLVIAAGTQARADLAITREPAVKIRGILGNFIPHQTVTFELLRGREDVSASRVTLNATTGRFEVLNVTPGSYVLRATQGQKTRAEVAVAVNGNDVDNVSLALAPAVTVMVLVHSLGSPPGPPEQEIQVFRRRGQSSGFCQVRLHSSERNAGVVMAQPNGATGESVIENVLPGAYRVALQCNGGYPASATTGNQDLLINPNLTIPAGAVPAPIEISLKLGGGALTGKLVLNPMPERAQILLLPAFTASTGPVLRPVFYQPEMTDGAPFGFASLAPGDYVVYAFPTDEVEFRNPAFLQALTGGVSVRMEESGQKEIILTSLAK
jgi:hypothetical protein